MTAVPLRARWLREMGYRPLVLRRPLPEPPMQGVTIEDATRVTRTAAPELAPPVMAAAPAPVDPLWLALLQACHAGPAEAPTLGWKQIPQDRAFAFVGAELHLNLSLLRREPAAKRALWRTLRALRRQRQGAT